MTGSDVTREVKEDTTMIVKIDDELCSIRMLPFVTKLSPTDVYKYKETGWGISLSC